MGKEEIVSRILSDAEEEAEAALAEAALSAENAVASARQRAEEDRRETEKEINERASRIREGRAAAARLDSAKILLAEQRRVIDEIYARALARLVTLGKRESLALLERLLKESAEEGDELVFAEDYPYAEEAKGLPVVKERKLNVSKERAPISGGCLLRNASCDKDCSFASLLARDREENESLLAERLFRAL